MKDDSKPEVLDPHREAEPPQPADSATETPSSPADTTDEVRRQCDEYRDLLVRTTAEFNNYRKRIEKERVEVAQAVGVDLITELLPLVDDLERALGVDATDDSARAYREGVELIHRQLLDLLRKRGVTPIETEGQNFDPNYHQAVSHEVSEGHRAGAVIGELRRGYMLGSRLLRPAMVRVAKA